MPAIKLDTLPVPQGFEPKGTILRIDHEPAPVPDGDGTTYTCGGCGQVLWNAKERISNFVLRCGGCGAFCLLQQ